MSLKKKIVKGIFHTGLAKYSNVLLSIIITSILARLLSPKEFGIVALVTVFTGFFSLLGDFGLGPAIIQNKSLDNNDISSIFNFSFLIGISVAGIFFFLGNIISAFYVEKELINIVRCLSLAVFLYTIAVVPRALIMKKLRFKQLGILSVGIQCITGSIAIYMAYAGYSYYSLVAKSILDAGLGFIGYLFLEPIKISKNISWQSVKKILSFSSYQFMFNFINYFSRNADNLLIGKYLGTDILGFYDKAYKLMLMPVQNLTHVITPVLQPILSEYQDDKKFIFINYSKIVKLLGLIGFPLSVFLFFSAQDIILIMFGDQWLASIPVFKVLGLTVGIQMVLSSSGSIFQSANRPDLFFLSGLLSAVTMVGGILYGVFIGGTLEVIGWCLLISFIINFFQGFYFLIVKVLESSMVEFLKNFIEPLIITIGLFSCYYLLANFIEMNAIWEFVVRVVLLLLILGFQIKRYLKLNTGLLR
jgi:PST family polysaccharide transporter